MNETEVPDWMIDQAIEEEKTVEELVLLVIRLVHALRKANPNHDLSDKAMDYLKRNGILMSALRDHIDDQEWDKDADADRIMARVLSGKPPHEEL